jgi:hypothetical protein
MVFAALADTANAASNTAIKQTNLFLACMLFPPVDPADARHKSQICRLGCGALIATRRSCTTAGLEVKEGFLHFGIAASL